MTKPKYKIDQLVEIQTGDTSTSHQRITGILYTNEGLSYQTKDFGFVKEESVIQGYKTLKSKKTKVTKMRAPRKPKMITRGAIEPEQTQAHTTAMTN